MKIIKQNRIIWLIPFVLLFICFLLNIPIWLSILLFMITFIACLIVTKKYKKETLLSIKKEKIHTLTSGIVIGKKDNSLLLTEEKRVLFVDKKLNNDFLNINIFSISKYKNKPNMIIIDQDQGLYNNNYDLLKREKYRIKRLNLENVIIDPFKIINHKIYNIKELESKVDNYKGQYLTTNKIYSSYDEIRIAIKKNKNEIIEIIEKFIGCYYSYNKEKTELLVLKSIFLYFIEEGIYLKNFVELSIVEMLDKILELSTFSTTKLKKYLQKNIDEDFRIKETLKEVKNTLELSKIFNNIFFNLRDFKKQIKSKKIYSMEGFYENNHVVFVNDEQKDLLELFLFMLNYVHLDSDIYLLMNSNVNYELSSKKIKIIHIVKDVKELKELNNYQVKVYRGKVNNENKKELLRLCKEELDRVELKEYNQVYNLLRIFDKMNEDKEEVLVIKSTKESFVTSFDTKNNVKDFKFKYINKN